MAKTILSGEQVRAIKQAQQLFASAESYLKVLHELGLDVAAQMAEVQSRQQMCDAGCRLAEMAAQDQ